MRQFIRHPVNIPIEIHERDSGEGLRAESSNVSRGGLALQCDRAMTPGTIAHLRIDCVTPRFEASARVAWCLPSDCGYELGVEFMVPEDALRARMVEQVCYIENYRRRVQDTEQRAMTANEAAHEWIEKYGSRFFESD
jgi:PilZ domain